MDGFERALPEQMGVDPAGLLDFVKVLDGNDCHSVMVLRHGKVICEGWWHPFRPEYGHIMHSMSKSFTSTAVGFAVEEGRFSVEDKVASFFPDKMPAKPAPYLAEMKVKHLLCMGTGHDPEPDIRETDEWIAGFLASDIPYEPGTHFTYNSMATFMLSAILQKQTGQKLVDYLADRLFAPLGIEGASWEDNPEGINVGGWGLKIKTADIAKLGQLYLNGGKWQGKQLISKDWVKNATTKQIESARLNAGWADWACGYGWQFWMCSEAGVYRGDGAKGQYCIVMPRQDMVIAMTAGCNEMNLNLEAVWAHVLPALERPASSGAQRQLEQKMAALAIPVATGSGGGAPFASASWQLEENPLGISSVGLSFGEGEDQLSVTFDDGRFTAMAGHGSWVESKLPVADKSGVDITGFFSDVASSSAVDGDDFIWKMTATGGDLEDTLRFSMDGDALELCWLRRPNGLEWTMKGRRTAGS